MALAAYSALRALGVLPDGSRTQRVGLFEVVYTSYEAFGHRGTQRTLFYRGGSRRRLVAQSVTSFRISPNDPRIVLYEYCPMNSEDNCGVHVFDGSRSQSWQISDQQLLTTSGTQVETSANGRFVVLASESEFLIIDLMKPHSDDLTAKLGLHAGTRTVRLGTWSPDQQGIVAFVGQYVDRAPPFVTLAEDLFVVDLLEGSARYVATAQPRGWRDRPYEWIATALGYTVPAPTPTASAGLNGTVYLKDTVDLPLGVLPQ